MIFLFLSQILRLFLSSTAAVSGGVVDVSNAPDLTVAAPEESFGGLETAIVLTTRMPIKQLVLERVYDLSKEIANVPSGGSRRYKIAVVVDVTFDREKPWRRFSMEAEDAFRDYYRRRQDGGSFQFESVVPLPLFFNVTEHLLFDEYPRLRNYFNNGPDEKNANNEPGHCCHPNFMWQGFVPILTMFMHYHPQFDYAWRIEDDIGAVGRDSLVTLIRDWDERLTKNGNIIDLAGQITHANGIPTTNPIVRLRHSMSFHDIIVRMGANTSDPERKLHPWWKRKQGQWRCYTDAIQRHSRRFSEELYQKISDNVYQFGECFVQPIAWNGNFTMMQLADIDRGEQNRVGNIEELTGPFVKMTREMALKLFMGKETYSTFLYHEEPIKG
uniref:Protein xylosyltransferase n=1 Tax=Odontella aurita TaxID=265563 RepID=A0A7S4JWT7_9STRA